VKTRTAATTPRGLSKDGLAARIAHDIPRGAFVNLGIGLPTGISNHLTPDSGVMLHTENGMLGMGPEAPGNAADLDLINAGKVPVTELPGASYFHHADSFAMMRGGHLDVCAIPAVGGAMDLAIGAKETFVMMNLLSRDGAPKLVPRCTYPLTGVGCVSRVYTDLAVFLIGDEGVAVQDIFGCTFDELADLLEVTLLDRTRQGSR